MDDLIRTEVQSMRTRYPQPILTMGQVAQYLSVKELDVLTFMLSNQIPRVHNKIWKCKPMDVAKFLYSDGDTSCNIATMQNAISALQSPQNIGNIEEDFEMAVLQHGEGSVYFDRRTQAYKCAFYYVDAQSKDKKRKILSAKTQEAVLEKVENFKQAVCAEADLQPITQTGKTYGEVFDEYWAFWEQKNRSFITAKDRRHLYSNYILPHFQNKPIQEIKAIDIQTFLNGFQRYPDGSLRSQSTIKKTWTSLKAVLLYAHNEDIIAKLPTNAVELPTGAQTNREDRFFEQQELVEIFADLKSNEKYFNIAKVLLGTGIRSEELLALTWSNIDVKEKTVKITNAVVPCVVDGATKHAVGPLKTATSNRTIYVGDVVIKALQALKAMLKETGVLEKSSTCQYYSIDSSNHVVTKHDTSDFVLLDKNGNIHLYHSLHNNYMKHIKNHGNFKHHANFYSFRHCFASYNRSVGIDPLVTSRFMGHSGTTLTETVYTSIPKEKCVESANLYNGFLQAIVAKAETL